MPKSKQTAAVAYTALLETLRSIEWGVTIDDEGRAWMLLMALSDALAPLGPVHMPTRAQIVALARRLERDAAIRAEFNGRNHAALAHRHRVATRTIRRILARRDAGGE